MSSTNGNGWTQTAGSGNAAYSTVDFNDSNNHQLQKFGMIIILDASAYAIDNSVLDQATIDFGLDAIAMISWTGRGAALRAISATADNSSDPVFGGSLTGTALGKDTTAPYIANKLSTIGIN